MHASPLTALASFPEHRLLASAAYDGAVCMWDAASFPLQARWRFQAADLVNHIQFSRDGRRVAVAAADGFVHLLDAQDGSLCGQLGPHGDDVNAVAWHPDGRLLACVMDAKDVQVALWDTQTGERMAPILGHEHGIFALAFDPTGRELVTAAEDGTCRIWELATRSQRALLAHPGDPETVDWSPRGDFIASGCDDGVLRVWDARTGELAKEAKEAHAAVRLVMFSPDGSQLLAGSYEGVLRLYDFPSMKVVRELQAPMQWERAAAFMAKGDLAVGSFGGRPIVHCLGGEVQGTLPTCGINSVSAQGADVVVGRDDGAVLSLLDGRLLHRHPSIVNTVVLGPESAHGLLGSGDYRGNLRLFDRKLGRVVAEHHLDSGPINTIAFHPDGQRLFTAGYDGVIREWDAGLKLLRTTRAHHGPIKSLAWSTVAGVLVAGSSDDTASVWRDGERIVHIERDELVLVNGVAASPVEPHFATASRDGIVRIWHCLTGALLDSLPACHIKSVKAIAYSDDGQSLLTGAYDGLGVLWSRQADGGWRLRRLALHGKPGVPAVAMAGQSALTAGWDGSVGRWSMQGELIAQYQAASLGR
jgi:WD40 repeat protein